MPLTSLPAGPEPAPPPPTATRTRRRRRRTRLAGAALAMLSLATVAELQLAPTSGADTLPVVGDTAADCAATGFPRPAGAVPPGYVYNPTLFNGTVVDPQPDDTFVSPAANHPVQAGRLQTRVANGREELLVCAHIGTNTPDDALSPFPVALAGGVPTIQPVVSIIGAGGSTTTYTPQTAGLTGTAIAHYAGSTDSHEGVLQMWVPFTPNMVEPGFVVRTEIRGTTALGETEGPTLIMGADEVFVHVGGAPVVRNAQVDQAVGVALDDSAIGERATDPGADDLQAVLKPLLPPILSSAVAAQAPASIDDSWDWSPGLALGTKASGTLRELPFYGGLDSLDVVDFNSQESRLQLHITGTMYPKLTLNPRAAGFVSIVSGSCDVSATVKIDLTVGITLDLNADSTRPLANVSILIANATTTSVQAEGTLLALYTVLPGPMSCGTIEDDIESGLADKVEERVKGLQGNADIQTKVNDAINTSTALDVADLANGPLSNAQVDFGAGRGFGIANARYVQTAPANHLGGKIWIWHEGVDVAASLAVTDKGGTRFPVSYRPTSTASVVQQTHKRLRPGASPLDQVVTGGVLTQAQLQQATATTTTPPLVSTSLGQLSTTANLSVAPTLSTTTTTAPVTKTANVAALPTGTVTANATISPTAVAPTATATATTVPTRTATTTAPTTATTVPTKTATLPTVTTVPTKGDTTTTTTPTRTLPTTSPTTTPTTAPTTTVRPLPVVTNPTAPVLAAPNPAVLSTVDPSILSGGVICCATYDFTPTDFDLGVVVNGASINQLSRALTAGSGVGTGILDIDATVGGNPLTIRPSVPPLYLPNAPTGWTAGGPVKLYVPSARLSMPGTPFSVAADASVGADFRIDPNTNHLVPTASSAVSVRLRFLRLAPDHNIAIDPNVQGYSFTAEQIAAVIGPKTVDIMKGVQIPDLKKFLSQSMVASHLTLQTTGGGHLGLYLNVDKNPATVGVGVGWTASPDVKPTSFSASASPANFPGDGAYSVIWTVRQGNVVKYQSAAPEGLSKAWGTSILSSSRTDNCSDEATFEVRVTAQVTRNGITQSGTTSSSSPSWTVPINTHICGGDTGPEGPGTPL